MHCTTCRTIHSQCNTLLKSWDPWLEEYPNNSNHEKDYIFPIRLSFYSIRVAKIDIHFPARVFVEDRNMQLSHFYTGILLGWSRAPHMGSEQCFCGSHHHLQSCMRVAPLATV